jgi:hypothetical protein
VKPFLYDEVLEVNKPLAVNSFLMDGIPIVIVDNLFKSIAPLKNIILNTPVGNWKYHPQGKNYVDYYDCRINFPVLQSELYNITTEIIKALYKKDTALIDGINVNWFKQINNKRSDYAFPHVDCDENEVKYTCIVYLNSKEESSGGTAFFKNKIIRSTIGTTTIADKFTEDYPQTYENGKDYWAPMEYWDMVGHVPMEPNRLVIFPAEYYHSAYHPQNSFYEFPRLSLAYWMKEINN